MDRIDPALVVEGTSTFENLQKKRVGLRRMWHAGLHSLAGLRDACSETAFRMEVGAGLVMVPAAFWVGHGWVEVTLLAGSVIFVLVIELLNTAVESVVDRIGLEWNPLSKRSKDLGSAAVLLTLVLCGSIWTAALWERFFR
jgi:diacylglycerol kinase (ATP)